MAPDLLDHLDGYHFETRPRGRVFFAPAPDSHTDTGIDQDRAEAA